ncbi:conserved hypothetical protein [groundwater metagenome]|uniref:CBS domain-containing protein n=1 Tax=groundwater metagenome TaxID=717931 RepID=A0A098E8N2_9ZZZZ
MKTIAEINERIRKGEAVVVTAEEMIDIVQEKGIEKAAKEVDVVTTGTMGAMCSSGAFLNFGHSDPPMKLAKKVLLNDVEAYGSIAAVDVYVGVAARSRKDESYGGGHVIEDLVNKKEIYVTAEGDKTDCYPKTSTETKITIDDLNQAILCNPRNAYQNYNVAVNSSDKTLYTYMGTLLPDFGNATFSSAGQLSPLINDPFLETIGIGTRIFLGGGTGYVIGEGTQHNTEVERINDVPISPAATLMVKGDLKQMNNKFLKGGYVYKYGTTLYVGIGVPIPILDERIAKFCSISDTQIFANVVDYSVQRRGKPTVRKISYAELRSGKITINNEEVPVSSLSSYKKAGEIASKLKNLILRKEFFLTQAVEKLPKSKFKPMKEITKEIKVKDVMKPAIVADLDSEISPISKIMIEKNVNHIFILDKGKMVGIVTSWDITKAYGLKTENLTDIMTRNVVVASPDENIEDAAKRLDEYNISALPVVVEKRVVGIITAENISVLIRNRKI